MIDESNWSCRAVALMLVAARSKAVPNFEPCKLDHHADKGVLHIDCPVAVDFAVD